MSEPTVTVITPVYNGRRWIFEAIRSVLAQTFTDFEYLLVDDGSTDGSAEILERFAAGDGRLRVIRRPANGGIAVTRNTGLQEARGRYVAMLDHDDVSQPRRLELQVRRLDREGDCVLLGSQVLLIDPDGRPISRMGGLPTRHDEIVRLLLAGRVSVHQSAMMMRRQAVWAVGGYRARFDGADDFDMYLRLTERGRAANLPEELCRYRQHFSSMQHSRTKRTGEYAALAVAEACARRGLDPAQLPLPPRCAARPQYELHARWGWSAIKAGNIGTTARHWPACLGKFLKGI